MKQNFSLNLIELVIWYQMRSLFYSFTQKVIGKERRRHRMLGFGIILFALLIFYSQSHSQMIPLKGGGIFAIFHERSDS